MKSSSPTMRENHQIEKRIDAIVRRFQRDHGERLPGQSLQSREVQSSKSGQSARLKEKFWRFLTMTWR